MIALRRSELSHNARSTGVFLGLRCQNSTMSPKSSPAVATLAEDVTLSTRAVIRAIAELERKGWVKVSRPRGGGRHDPSDYELTWPPGAGERVERELGGPSRSARVEAARPTRDEAPEAFAAMVETMVDEPGAER
jgi:hypothetical protein